MTTTELSAASTVDWNVETLNVCGGEISVRRAGHGPAVMVLTRDNGHAPQNEFLDRLAGSWLPTFSAYSATA